MELALMAVGIDDVDAIHDLYRRWEAYWKVPLVTPRDEIADELTDPHLNPDLDTRGVWLDGRLVAYGIVFHTPSGQRQERAFITGKVDPDMRNNGLGRRLLAWQMERATEKLRQCDPGLPWYIRAYEWEWIGDALRLHRRFGLETVRWFEDMVRPLDPPLGLDLPDGVSILPWDEVTDEETRRTSNESFADHWGSTPRDSAAWAHVLAAGHIRRDLSFVAVAGSEVIGVCLNGHVPEDEQTTGRRDGWIEHLGVTRPWRRRGVAGALIARSLEAFRQAGFTHAMLGVDTDNPTGASGLYRNLGFEPLHRTVTNQIRVPPL